jgi:MSHA biogenesis protein MshN
MSVINNVLKSLESRESQFTPIEIPSIKQGTTARKNRKLQFSLGMALLLLLVAGGYYWQNPAAAGVIRDLLMSPNPDETPQSQLVAAPAVEASPQPDAEVYLAAQPVTQPTAPTVALAAPEPLPANQITGLQIREAETEMQLEFVLRERTSAYLKERAENSFSYHLSDIESQIVAPVIRDNRWIRKLTIQQDDSGVDINFLTAPDILVEARQSEQDGKAVWMINLRAAVALQPARAAQPQAVAPPPVREVTPPAIVEPEPAVAKAPMTLNIKSANPVTKVTNQLDYAVQLMNSNRSDEAETLLRKLFGGTHDYSARKHLLALYTRMNRPARLRSLLQSSLLEYPQDPLFTTEYARALFAARAYREVIAVLGQEQGLDADKEALLAASYQRLDQHEAAIHHYQLALQQDAKNARNWVGLAISQEQSAAFGAALDAYQQASRLGGLNARLRDFVERRSDKLQQVVN